MTLDPTTKLVADIVFGYTLERVERLQSTGTKLAHYTTADVAAQILLKKNVWMRNASSMNDYMEISFGRNCLLNALEQRRDRLSAVVNGISPNLLEETLDWMERADFNHQNHTHLTCLTEHEHSDELGQLSMWRAYGGPVAGIALIFNTYFLDFDSNELASWSSPVVYGEQEYLTQFDSLIARLEASQTVLQSVPPKTLKSLLFNALQFSILSAKHVGFREEREWRIIHGPRELSSAFVQSTFENIRGKPEVVYHLPLENMIGMEFEGLELTKLLHKVIVGPCQNPYQVASTFADILLSCGFENPAELIRVSLIPLRQQG